MEIGATYAPTTVQACDTESTIVIEREKRGQCPTCGQQVVKVNKNMFGKEKSRDVLTIEGLVRNGRCLTCKPDPLAGGAAAAGGSGAADAEKMADLEAQLRARQESSAAKDTEMLEQKTSANELLAEKDATMMGGAAAGVAAGFAANSVMAAGGATVLGAGGTVIAGPAVLAAGAAVVAGGTAFKVGSEAHRRYKATQRSSLGTPSAMILTATMEGQLKKKGQKRGALGDSWKDRYFIYDGALGIARFFEGGSTEGKPKGEATVTGINPLDELQGRKDGKPHRFNFALEDGTEVCVSAPSAARRRQWIDVVAAATVGGGGTAAAPIAAVAAIGTPVTHDETRVGADDALTGGGGECPGAAAAPDTSADTAAVEGTAAAGPVEELGPKAAKARAKADKAAAKAALKAEKEAKAKAAKADKAAANSQGHY